MPLDVPNSQQPKILLGRSYAPAHPMMKGFCESFNWESRRSMKPAVQSFLEYLRVVRNSSPHTVLNYGKDLQQFLLFLSPPGAKPPALGKINHTVIREFVGHLHDLGLEKSSVARKLAALRSFFKYCVREGMLKENPARLVPTPKLPKRLPSVLSAEEMNDFLNQLATMAPAAGGRVTAPGPDPGERAKRTRREDDGLL